MAKIDPADIGRPLTVGEVARRAGVAVSALHFYESKGLIRSVRRFSRNACSRAQEKPAF